MTYLISIVLEKRAQELESKKFQLEGELNKIRLSLQQETKEKEQLNQSKKEIETQLIMLTEARSQLQFEVKHKVEEIEYISNQKARLTEVNKELQDQLAGLKVILLKIRSD